jgi:hypothetical protein
LADDAFAAASCQDWWLMTDLEGAAMLNDRNQVKGPQFESGPMITAAVLVGAGAVLVFAGFAVGGGHMLQAVRRWVNDMEVPPSERAKLALAQARAAAAAGAEAWQKAPQPA